VPTNAPVVRRQLRGDDSEAVRHGLPDILDVNGGNGSGNSTSYEPLFGTKSVTFPMLMAVISVDNGEVQVG
jgi:hypothetical protein